MRKIEEARRGNLALQFLFIFFVICFVVSGPIHSETAESQESFMDYPVRDVIDGDTIELKNRRRVRYIGIDTPETMIRVDGSWKFSPERFAMEAKSFNRSLVFGKRVRLEFDAEEEDTYGRWLAYVYVGDTMANEEILRQGYAILLIIPPNTRHLQVLVDAQQEAKAKKRGIWGDIKTITPESASEYIDMILEVKGEVFDIGRSKKAIYLNFGEGRDSFTAVIYSKNLVFFEKEGIRPDRDYEGKVLSVTGKVRDRKGPRIVISHPSQVSVVK